MRLARVDFIVLGNQVLDTIPLPYQAVQVRLWQYGILPVIPLPDAEVTRPCTFIAGFAEHDLVLDNDLVPVVLAQCPVSGPAVPTGITTPGHNLVWIPRTLPRRIIPSLAQ